VISYGAAAIGLLPVSAAEVAWTTPAIISGYAAAGSAAGSVMQLVNIFAGFLIYLPFVHMAEKIRRYRFDVSYGDCCGQAEAPAIPTRPWPDSRARPAPSPAFWPMISWRQSKKTNTWCCKTHRASPSCWI
jgi:hypothetical protein